MKELNEPRKLRKPEKLVVSEKKYLETRLKGMDEVKKRWYMNAMKTWTKEDYDNYTKFHVWMFGLEGGSNEAELSPSPSARTSDTVI